MTDPGGRDGVDPVPIRWRGPLRGRGRGLRARATLAFAGVALLLSAVVATTAWATVTGFLLVQRERAAVSQTVVHVDQVAKGLRLENLSSPQLLAQLSREIGSTSLLSTDEEWFTTSLRVDRASLPTQLREAVAEGQPSSQRIEVNGRPMLAVGLPLPQPGHAYFEVFPLTELDETFRTVSTVLVAAAVAVPLGSLLLGWWVMRPALRPLDSVATAAAAIAAGDLTARLDPHGDPGLASIAASFNETAEALERRVRADARFAADVSHELRSPLTTMVSAVALVDADRGALSSQGREALDLLAAEVERFRRLAEDLLEISRSDAGSADLVLEEVAVAELVREAVPATARELVEVDRSAVGLRVLADKRRLERVVRNLVDNAEQHGDGVRRLAVAQVGDWAEVVVEDEGPGLDDRERERIFDRFARGRRSGRHSTDGAGLGLSLVARHVHLLGGTVDAQDRPGGGARFVVRLPVAPDEPCDDASPD